MSYHCTNKQINILKMKNLDFNYVNQINNLEIKNLEIIKVENKKHQYHIECYVNTKHVSFSFNNKLKKTTSCSLSKYSDKISFPNLGDNFIYVINQRINKDVSDKLTR